MEKLVFFVIFKNIFIEFLWENFKNFFGVFLSTLALPDNKEFN